MVTKTRRAIAAVVASPIVLSAGILMLTGGAAPDASPSAPLHADDPAIAWLARILLVLAVAWVVIGMIAARTSLVRRPGAAAARVSWIAATRPWRARESTLGMLPLDRWLLLLVPGALLVATRALQSALVSPLQLAVTLGGWIVFAIVVRAFVGRRSPWPVLAAAGGVVVFRCILTLAALSATGPGESWEAFWEHPARRVLYVTVSLLLLAWLFVAAGWALSTQLGIRRSAGAVIAAIGAGLAVPAAVIGLVGLEAAAAVWVDQLGILRWGLSRILGITEALHVPSGAAWLLVAAGLVLVVIGALLMLPARRRED